MGVGHAQSAPPSPTLLQPRPPNAPQPPQPLLPMAVPERSAGTNTALNRTRSSSAPASRRRRSHPVRSGSISEIDACRKKSGLASHGRRGCASPTSHPLACPGWQHMLGLKPTRRWFSSSARFNGSIEAMLRLSGYRLAHNQSVVVLGVGHAGTSSIACMLRDRQAGGPTRRRNFKELCELDAVVHANEAICRWLGWTWCTQPGLVGHHGWSWNETSCPLVINRTNVWRAPLAHLMHAGVWQRLLDTGVWQRLRGVLGSPQGATSAVRQRLRKLLKKPLGEWPKASTQGTIWKDPRFTWTLHIWQELLFATASRELPLLIYVRRSPQQRFTPCPVSSVH